MEGFRRAAFLLFFLALHSNQARGKYHGCCSTKSITQVVSSGANVVGATASAISQTASASAGASLSVGFANGGITASGSLSASASVFGESSIICTKISAAVPF